MRALPWAELRPRSAAEVMAFWGASSTSDGDDPFMETALKRGSAQSWSGWDEPFLSQINYNYAKLFLIGLEMPENKHLQPLWEHGHGLLFNEAFLIFSFTLLTVGKY